MTTTLKPKPAALGKMDYIPHANTVFCVTFDFADAEHFVYERHEMDNLIPFRNFHGHAATYELPANADASMFEEWITEIVQPFVTRVSAGYATAWKDGNEIAIYSADAVSAKEQIDYLLDHGNGSMAAIPRLKDWQGRFYAGEYLWEIRHYLIEDYGITAETSDEQIFGIADKINAYMVNDYVYLDGIADYLLKLRDNIREDEIAIRAKQVEMLGAIDEHAPAKEKETMIMTTTLTPYVTPKQNNFTRLMDDAEAAADQAFIAVKDVRQLMHEMFCAAPEGYQDSSEGQMYQDAIDRMDTVLFAFRTASDRLTGANGYLAELPETLPKA